MTGQGREATWEALNPIGERDLPEYLGLSSRLATLDGKTIGLFDNAKRSCPYVLGKVEKLLQARFPSITITWFKKGTYKDILWEKERDWAKNVDGVIGMFGD